MSVNTFSTESTAQFFLPGSVGDIEIASTYPAAPQKKVIVICHPHPLQGGTMLNKVVTTLVRTFNEINFKTVRFNFRGVGLTQGEHDQGRGEADDTVTVLDWVQSVLPDDELWLAGFSFGAFIAYKVATTSSYKNKIKQLVCVAPPIHYPEFQQLPAPSMPCLVVQGDEDEVVDPQAVFTWLNSVTPSPTLLKMSTGHFFHGQLVELKHQLQARFS